ncbi:maleylpyruvate isomerase family mycothiol-dependent enzyme [Nakamurella sp. GG22]
MSNSTWDLIHAERRSLIRDLQLLTDEQWLVTSLCPDWTVHMALGHVVALTKQTPPKFFAKFASSGFRFNTMAAKDIARESAGTPQQTLAELTAHVDDTTAPPGPFDSWVGEMVVHGADIRRPLGIDYSPPVATTRQAADFYKNSNLLIGAKNRIAGVKLVATDTDWSHGSGPEVSGPILSLVLAMTGRSVALSDLTGDGVGTLQAAMPTG